MFYGVDQDSLLFKTCLYNRGEKDVATVERRENRVRAVEEYIAHMGILSSIPHTKKTKQTKSP